MASREYPRTRTIAFSAVAKVNTAADIAEQMNVEDGSAALATNQAVLVPDDSVIVFIATGAVPLHVPCGQNREHSSGNFAANRFTIDTPLSVVELFAVGGATYASPGLGSRPIAQVAIGTSLPVAIFVPGGTWLGAVYRHRRGAVAANGVVADTPIHLASLTVALTDAR